MARHGAGWQIEADDDGRASEIRLRVDDVLQPPAWAWRVSLHFAADFRTRARCAARLSASRWQEHPSRRCPAAQAQQTAPRPRVGVCPSQAGSPSPRHQAAGDGDQ
jgi:hypothetical protein